MYSNKYNIPIGIHYISFNTKFAIFSSIDQCIYSILRTDPKFYICVAIIKHMKRINDKEFYTYDILLH